MASAPALQAEHPRLTEVATALWSQARVREVAGTLADAGVPALLLKGPSLQQRLYGTPARYVSGDADVLVPRRSATRARVLLERDGWRFERENGVLWRLSAAATYEKNGFRLDLHWGLHAAHLPAAPLRALERHLWRGAAPGLSGMLEPRAEPLVVFLAVHVVGHDFERPQWAENVHAAAELVGDWEEVQRIAREARVSRALRAALEGRPPGTHVAVLDGAAGRAIAIFSWLGRGHFLPRGVRASVRESLRLAADGFGLVRPTEKHTVTFAGLELDVEAGVFPPRQVSEGLVALALDAIENVSQPVVLELGTGSGAIALAIAEARSDARVVAVDVSARAVRCARRNAERLRLDNVTFRRGDLFEAVPEGARGRIDVAVSNLPYVDPRTAYGNEWDAPMTAIVGEDADGLGLMRTMARDVMGWLRPSAALVYQIGSGQWDSFAAYLRELGYETPEPRARRPNSAATCIAYLRGSVR